MKSAFALLLLAAACRPDARSPAETIAERDDSRWIALRRTRCYGSCPAYTVKLFADGRSSWIGHDNVTKIGPASGTVDRSAVADLLRELEGLDLSSVPHDMPRGNDCGTDAPSAIVTAVDGGRTIRAFHYYGCEGPVLEQLTRIEDAIDRAAGVERWLRDPACTAYGTSVFFPAGRHDALAGDQPMDDWRRHVLDVTVAALRRDPHLQKLRY